MRIYHYRCTLLREIVYATQASHQKRDAMRLVGKCFALKWGTQVQVCVKGCVYVFV